MHVYFNLILVQSVNNALDYNGMIKIGGQLVNANHLLLVGNAHPFVEPKYHLQRVFI